MQVQCQLHPGPALPPHSHGHRHFIKARFQQDAAEMWNRTCLQAHPRVWNTNSTTSNHSTTPVHVLSCTAASKQDVSQEKPHSCSQSPAGITRGDSTGHRSHPGAVQAHRGQPRGQLIKITPCRHRQNGDRTSMTATRTGWEPQLGAGATPAAQHSQHGTRWWGAQLA